MKDYFIKINAVTLVSFVKCSVVKVCDESYLLSYFSDVTALMHANTKSKLSKDPVAQTFQPTVRVLNSRTNQVILWRSNLDSILLGLIDKIKYMAYKCFRCFMLHTRECSARSYISRIYSVHKKMVTSSTLTGSLFWFFSTVEALAHNYWNINKIFLWDGSVPFQTHHKSNEQCIRGISTWVLNIL